MLAAVQKGDTKTLAELMRQDPGFNVNMSDRIGRTLLHFACLKSSRSAVIPLLLAHPDIDVNVKDVNVWTPFFHACYDGSTSCVREMLKDSRLKVNDPSNDGCAPLWRAAANGHLDIIKWWIVSRRETDLGKPEDYSTDVIGGAKWYRKTVVATLLEIFKENPEETRRQLRVELGWYDALAAEMFALVVFVSDGLLQIDDTTLSSAARFFTIAAQLPLELQMVLCYRLVGAAKEIILGKDSEVAFKWLARRLL